MLKTLERTDSAPPQKPIWKIILGVPYLIGERDYGAYKTTFAYKFKVLWAKTFLSSDDYTPPSRDHRAGQLYGKPIPAEALGFNEPDEDFDAPVVDLASKKKLAGKNPYSLRGGVKAFFGFPYEEENGVNGVRQAGFVIKLLPKIILNTLKLFTEILPGSLVAASNTLIDKATDKFFLSKKVSNQLGWYVALTIGRILLPISSLLHFTGKSITSPLDNIVDTWKYFADMRAKKEWYWKALGWTLGILGSVFSIATTAAMYFLLAPLVAAVSTIIGSAMGLSSAISAVTAGATTLFQLMGPVTTFLSAFLSTSLTSLSGLILGVVVPTIVAPILTGVDKAVSWLANKVVEGIHWLRAHVKKQQAHPVPQPQIPVLVPSPASAILNPEPNAKPNAEATVNPDQNKAFGSTALVIPITGYNSPGQDSMEQDQATNASDYTHNTVIQNKLPLNPEEKKASKEEDIPKLN